MSLRVPLLNPRRLILWLALAGPGLGASLAVAQPADAGKPVYRCPGPPVLYTDALTPTDARARNCRSIESTPITVVQGVRKAGTPVASAPAPTSSATAAAAAARPADTRVDPSAQRARDTDARRILEAELRKEEDALAALKKDFNNGEPERKGDERNFAKYQERVAEMRAAITRKEADVAAIKRELAKLPGG
ncbi:MAG: hypothetical protein LW854_05420 [Rubrivivax sp.]|jgi:hypothetical protein|nr:hypothetical protein [Rubrivivax sp.]